MLEWIVMQLFDRLRPLGRLGCLLAAAVATVATSAPALRSTMRTPIKVQLLLQPGERQTRLLEFAANQEVEIETTVVERSAKVPATPSVRDASSEDTDASSEDADASSEDADAGDAGDFDGGEVIGQGGSTSPPPDEQTPPPVSKQLHLAQEDVRDSQCAESDTFERTGTADWKSLAKPSSRSLGISKKCGARSGAIRVVIENTGPTALDVNWTVTFTATNPDTDTDEDPTLDVRVVE